MQIDFSVERAGDTYDVSLRAEPDTTVALLRAHLLDDATEDSPLWSGSRLLTAQQTLHEAALRHGSVVRIGHRPPVAAGNELVSLNVIGGPCAGRRLGLRTGRITIGRAATCDLVLADADVSRLHASIEISGSGLTLIDESSTNGTMLEGQRITEPMTLFGEQVIRLGDSYLGVSQASTTPTATRPFEGFVITNRPPRLTSSVVGREIALPQLADTSAPRRLQIAAALLPAVASVALAVALGSVQFLFFGLLSPLMLLASAFGDRWHWRRSRRRARSNHTAQLARAELEIRRAMADEQQRRRAHGPDPTVVEEIVSAQGSRLWERRLGDADFLSARLGVADLPSLSTVREGSSVRPAWMVHAVPVLADLTQGALGMTGPETATRACARWVVAQLCALHSPTDLDLALLVDSEHEADWHWARWLPHLRGRVASTPQEQADLMKDLIGIAHERLGANSRQARGGWLVLIVDSEGAAASLAHLAELLGDTERSRITAVCLADAEAGLPGGCRTIAVTSGTTGTRLSVRAGGSDPVDAVLDQVSSSWCDSVARALAPLRDADRDPWAALPGSCSLHELLRSDGGAPTADDVARYWESSDGGCATTIGVGADGAFVLDLVEDGPHALVAGTTGSGKSELLQTLVAGLAVRYPPDQVSFLLFDYKGGAAFAECADLPHTAGLVTDLDAQLTRRALQTLDAELRRRERLFADAAAGDIAAYRRASASEAVPRLVLVVDEFAALADEFPDFVKGLVSIAQRGRSLGVHLVLATQRPGAAVSPEIRANTSIRICLRVTDARESHDVIETADAALIDRRTPGRAIARLGQSIKPFQTASVGVSRRGESAVQVERLGSWLRRPVQTFTDGRRDLSTLVLAIRAAAAETHRPATRPPWCDPLPDLLNVSECDPSTRAAIAIGIVDLPTLQQRQPLAVDLADGTSALFAGSTRSGRSTALCTLAIQAAQHFEPGQLHIQCVDASGGLAALRALPHCASYLDASAPAAWAALARRLVAELERRRQWLAERGYSSAESARAAGHAIAGILVLVDTWDAVANASDERDAGRTSELLLTIARTGAAAGISVVACGGRGLLAPRVASTFAHRYLFALNEPSDYAAAGIATRDVPARMPPGRALRATDGAAAQIALAGAEPTRSEQDRVIAQLRASASGTAIDAIRIRPLPAAISLDDVTPCECCYALGVGGDSAAAVRVDLSSGPARLLILGPARSGRTTALRTVLRQAPHPSRVCVIASERSQLARDAARVGASVVNAHSTVPANTISRKRGLVLIDDVDRLGESALAGAVLECLHDESLNVSVVASGRTDDVASAYRGVCHELRRHRRGLLLQPGPADGDVFGLRLPRDRDHLPAGRGLLIAADLLCQHIDTRTEPLPIQVATP